MNPTGRKIEFAATLETEARSREIQLLINVVEPDPEYQPVGLTDEASLLDAVATSDDDMLRRLSAYFRADLELDLRMPIWRLVDVIKRMRPGWPDDAGPS